MDDYDYDYQDFDKASHPCGYCEFSGRRDICEDIACIHLKMESIKMNKEIPREIEMIAAMSEDLRYFQSIRSSILKSLECADHQIALAEESIKIYKKERDAIVSGKPKATSIEFEGDVMVFTDSEFDYLDVDVPQNIDMKNGKYRMTFTKVDE